MKRIIATGKGGVGKTTTLSTLCVMLARSGKKVIVFDTDPSMNLALTFGIPYDATPTITEDKAHISHDIGEENIADIGDEIINDHSAVTKDGIRVVIMGAILHGGGGCLCSAISLVKILLDFVGSNGDYDIAVVDSQAGPEILGRGLAESFDCNLILTEPTPKSSEVSRQVLKLAKDLGIKENLLIVNKVDRPEDVNFTAHMTGIESFRAMGIRYDKDVIAADREGDLLIDTYPDSMALEDINIVRKGLEKVIRW